MATLQDIENSLPNGFHDSRLRACQLDFVSRTASFELEVAVGDSEAADAEDRDRYAPAILLLDDLAFCELQPPDPAYPFQNPSPVLVALSDPGSDHPVVKTLPNGIFSGRFFVTNWNSFIYVAARHARLEWVET